MWSFFNGSDVGRLQNAVVLDQQAVERLDHAVRADAAQEQQSVTQLQAQLLALQEQNRALERSVEQLKSAHETAERVNAGLRISIEEIGQQRDAIQNINGALKQTLQDLVVHAGGLAGILREIPGDKIKAAMSAADHMTHLHDLLDRDERDFACIAERAVGSFGMVIQQIPEFLQQMHVEAEALRQEVDRMEKNLAHREAHMRKKILLLHRGQGALRARLGSIPERVRESAPTVPERGPDNGSDAANPNA